MIKHAVTGVHNDIQSHPVTTASSTNPITFTGCLSYDWLLGRSLWTAWCKISCWSPPKFHPLLVESLFPFSVLAKLSITTLLKLLDSLSNARHEEIFWANGKAHLMALGLNSDQKFERFNSNKSSEYLNDLTEKVESFEKIYRESFFKRLKANIKYFVSGLSVLITYVKSGRI